MLLVNFLGSFLEHYFRIMYIKDWCHDVIWFFVASNTWSIPKTEYQLQINLSFIREDIKSVWLEDETLRIKKNSRETPSSDLMHFCPWKKLKMSLSRPLSNCFPSAPTPCINLRAGAATHHLSSSSTAPLNPNFSCTFMCIGRMHTHFQDALEQV